MKRQDELTEEDRIRARSLALMLKQKLEANLLLDPEKAKPGLQEAAELRAELEDLGFWVSHVATLDIRTLKLAVEVTLSVLKPASEIN